MYGTISADNARALARVEWVRDASKNASFLPKSAFYDAIFEVTDMWYVLGPKVANPHYTVTNHYNRTNSLDSSEYVDFLVTLFRAIAKPVIGSNGHQTFTWRRFHAVQPTTSQSSVPQSARSAAARTVAPSDSENSNRSKGDLNVDSQKMRRRRVHRRGSLPAAPIHQLLEGNGEEVLHLKADVPGATSLTTSGESSLASNFPETPSPFSPTAKAASTPRHRSDLRTKKRRSRVLRRRRQHRSNQGALVDDGRSKASMAGRAGSPNLVHGGKRQSVRVPVLNLDGSYMKQAQAANNNGGNSESSSSKWIPLSASVPKAFNNLDVSPNHKEGA